MIKVSYEYFHSSPIKGSSELKISNLDSFAHSYLKSFSNRDGQACIMLDDIHSDIYLNADFFDRLIASTEVKPDCVYLESSFLNFAETLVSELSDSVLIKEESDDKLWLRSVKGKYDYEVKFSARWKNSDKLRFSCPVLVATSYLVRLGVFPPIETVWGEKLKPAKSCVQILDKSYLSVESQAQLIIKAFDSKLESRISWIFL